MRSFDQSFSCSSPLLVMSPQHTPQPSFGMASQRPSFNSTFPNGLPLSSVSNATPSTHTPSSAAGRKRSRDETSFADDEYFPLQNPPAPVQEAENEDEWVYGEGMTLIKPNGNDYLISADSQTGTWAEEKADEKAQSAVAVVNEDKPILRSHKSQRLDITSPPAIAEDVSLSQGQHVDTLLSLVASGPIGPTEPTIDDFTRYLGIGWSSVDNHEDRRPAVRGWTKFLENHYPINDVRIRLQSTGLASFLVEANEGYFLFGDDLKHGQLVSTTLEQTFVNLRGPVPEFEGTGVMEAGDTPKTMDTMDTRINDKSHMATIATESVVLNGFPAQALEVEMDMS